MTPHVVRPLATRICNRVAVILVQPALRTSAASDARPLPALRAPNGSVATPPSPYTLTSNERPDLSSGDASIPAEFDGIFPAFAPA